MLKIGLTGGIGSGKTTIANLFAEQGVPIIDTDIISRQIVEPGSPALAEISAHFGTDTLTSAGELDRHALRKRIFEDPAKRKSLEAILHPRIQKEMLNQAEQLDSDYCIFVIPLLLEAKQTHLVDRILVVDCDDHIRRQRLKERDKMSDHEINDAFAAQASRQQRLDAADDIIANNSTLEKLRPQVIELHSRYTLLAGHVGE